jgi:hypothetical protein
LVFVVLIIALPLYKLSPVNVPASIVLLVNVSDVLFPIKVVVDVGNVKTFPVPFVIVPLPADKIIFPLVIVKPPTFI